MRERVAKTMTYSWPRHIHDQDIHKEQGGEINSICHYLATVQFLRKLSFQVLAGDWNDEFCRLDKAPLPALCYSMEVESAWTTLPIPAEPASSSLPSHTFSGSLVHNLEENILLAIRPPQSSLEGKKVARLATRTDLTRGAHSGTGVAV